MATMFQSYGLDELFLPAESFNICSFSSSSGVVMEVVVLVILVVLVVMVLVVVSVVLVVVVLVVVVTRFEKKLKFGDN